MLKQDGWYQLFESPHIFSFFSGAGFLDLGFEHEDFTVAFVNEIHWPFLHAYKYSREQMGLPSPKYGYHERSVTSFENGSYSTHLEELIVESRKHTNAVGFIAGPPCPDFSVGGKNRGKQGEKGRLSRVYIDLIVKQQPDFFLYENVKGLWRTAKHREFYEEMKRLTEEADYVLTERVINTIEYDVPQDRHRIILLGFKRDLLTSIGFQIADNTTVLPDGLFPWRQYTSYSSEEVFSLPWPDVEPFSEEEPRSRPEGILEHLTVEHWFQHNDVSNHPNALHHFKPRAGLPRFQTVDEGDVSRKSFKRLHRWRYSPTAAYGNNEVHLHPYKARRISAAEALAIQSLPREFCLPPDMSLSNMFKTIGNGVPYLAARALARSLCDFLKGNSNEVDNYRFG